MIVAVARKARRKSRNQGDLGPSTDPIRQQGRDPGHVYETDRWFPTPQRCDLCRTAPCVGRRRLYHDSYRTSSGHTWDEFFEVHQRLAEEFEEAGINLGWGGCASAGCTSVRGSVDMDIERRYIGPPNNAYLKKRLVTSRS